MFFREGFVFSLVISSILVFSFSNSYADRYKRPMIINKVKRVGLEVWTEMEPKWKTEVMVDDNKPIFVAHSPAYSYPVSGMMWVNHAEVQLKLNEFPEVANAILISAARQYGVSKEKISISPKKYGFLDGYEANFLGVLDNQSVDVKVFTGRADDKGPVTMHVYTTKGKIKHLEEQIRRSWTHTNYLVD